MDHKKFFEKYGDKRVSNVFGRNAAITFEQLYQIFKARMESEQVDEEDVVYGGSILSTRVYVSGQSRPRRSGKNANADHYYLDEYLDDEDTPAERLKDAIVETLQRDNSSQTTEIYNPGSNSGINRNYSSDFSPSGASDSSSSTSSNSGGGD